MKKLVALLTVSFALLLAACGGGDTENGNAEVSSDEPTVIEIGASSEPHANILEEAEPLLEEEGIELDIEPYEGYVLPNDDLASGELDANYFQHIPFLEQTIEDTDYDLEPIGSIHIEPMGVYSKDFDSVDDIPDGTEVIMSNSVADHGRVLGLFEAEGLITLKDGVELEEATIDDIEDNPQNLEFTPDYEPALLPEIYETEDDIVAVINTNYAIEADLNPLEDAMIIESDESPYVNVIAVKAEDTDDEALNKLVDVLHSDEIQEYITNEFEGAIVPVSN